MAHAHDTSIWEAGRHRRIDGEASLCYTARFSLSFKTNKKYKPFNLLPVIGNISGNNLNKFIMPSYLMCFDKQVIAYLNG